MLWDLGRPINQTHWLRESGGRDLILTGNHEMPDFIPGLELARLYYEEIVRPILQADYPNLVHSAGLIGSGSEVLGFDTEMSADHDWGTRLSLFLSVDDHARVAAQVRQTLAYKLPFSFRGYPTHFEDVPDDTGTRAPKLVDQHPIQHRVHITVLSDFLRRYIGVDLDQEWTALDWLTVPEQKLRTLVAGAVYHDGLNVLRPMRRTLAYYPRDVWLYLLSAQWARVGQEQPFVGRAGIVGDELGSALIATALVGDLMRLGFLMEKQYAPYSKWFGTAFAQLNCAATLTPILQRVLNAPMWQEREKHLGAALETAAALHNDLGITLPVPTKASQFHDRPFSVIGADDIAERIWQAIRDEEVQALPRGVGKVEQVVDNTDVLSNTDRCRKLRALYAAE
jgi:hypothetical protein